jgi:glycosyltransferase involved in cell wall biosynthesis
MSKRLLLVGSNTIHIYTYLDLVSGFFDDVTIITNEVRQGRNERMFAADFSYRLSSLVSTCRIIRKEIMRLRPDVIHVHQVNSYALYTLIATRGLKIPVVITAWGSDILVAPNRNRLMRKIVSYCLKKADYLTSDSSFMAEEMRKIARPKNNIVLANFGIDRVEISAEKENVFYSNRLHKKLYNVDRIIRSFADFMQHPKHAGWRLVIAATGEETSQLKSLAESLEVSNAVEFVGWLSKEENARWYAKAKYWVSIPDSDATSISLLEAMAHGCIPIVSDLPANREWIQDGLNGWIVDPSANSFMSNRKPLDEMQARIFNSKLIEEKATKEVNRAKFIELYKRALKLS